MLGEAVLITLLLGAFLTAQLVASRSTSLLTRKLGLDEIITEMLVVDPDGRRSLRAIIGGLDTNPPAYHLLLRPFRLIIARRAEISLRIFSLLAALLALVGVYLSLRQVYAPLIALAAILAVWGHPLLQRCAVEGRMYAPWLAAVAWFSYLLSRAWSGSENPWVPILLALTAVLTCMLHTLGPLSFLLVSGAQVMFNDVELRSWQALMSASVGFILFIAWLPVVWKQSVANPVTWVSRATTVNVANFARAVLIPSLIATLLLVSAGFATILRLAPPSSLREPAGEAAALAGLAALVLMPIALVVLSYTVEPLLVDRYATPAVLGFAPAIAALIAPLEPFWIVVLSGALVMIGTSHLQSLRAHYGQRDRLTAELIEAIHRHTGESPVFFETLHEYSVVARYAELPSRRYVALDFDDDALDAGHAARVSTRNQKRLISRHYGSMTLMSWRAVRTLPELHFVASQAAPLEREVVELEKRYPEFAVLPLQGGLYRLVARREVTNPGEDSRSAPLADTCRSAARSANGTAIENARD